MPTPVGHALGGVIVALILGATGAARATGVRGAVRSAGATDATGPTRRTDLRFLLLCAAAACFPDTDFLWGRHNMETHSIGFAVIVGLSLLVWRRSTRVAVACALAVISHVLFDWLGSDDTPPLGVMALWPLSREFYFANAFVFEAISRRYWLAGFIRHNLLAVLREIAILLPIAALLWWSRRR